jgi:DNA helicase-2/ATP-dependent DNA helicase PcrA
MEDLSAAVRKKAKETFSLFEGWRAQANALSLAELTLLIVEQTKYLDYLRDQGPEGQTRVENVKELIGGLTGEGTEGLREFLDHVALITDLDEYKGDVQRVSLMTLHSAKGLEFPVVFMVGMEEGLLPYYLRLDNPEELQEERRLCYVGMTRARERLFMSGAITRYLFGMGQRRIPSRFLRDIPEEIIRFEGRPTPLVPSSWAWEEGLFSEDRVIEYD